MHKISAIQVAHRKIKITFFDIYDGMVSAMELCTDMIIFYQSIRTPVASGVFYILSIQ